MMKDITPSKHRDDHDSDPSDSVPSLRHLPGLPDSPSVSLRHSKGDSPLYASTLVQDPSVIDLPSHSDIIIAYVLIRQSSLYPKLKNTPVSWARLERVKVQSVSCALIPLNVIHSTFVVY